MKIAVAISLIASVLLLASCGGHSTNTTGSSNTSPSAVADGAVAVKVNSPTSTTVSSPVKLSATATSSYPVTGWQVYVDSASVYQTGEGSSINPSLSLSSGSHNIVVQAWNSQGTHGSASMAITVAAGASSGAGISPIAFTTTSLPDGTVGAAYNAKLAASGGTAPYIWSVVSGKLPAGLALSGAGVITGTPTTSGTVTFYLQVKDSSSSPQAATMSESIAIASPVAGTASLSIQVSGNHLVNQDGQTVHLIGFGAQGSEYTCVSSNGTFDDPNTLTTTPENMKGWGAGVNIARIPLNEDCWLGINGVSRGGAAYQNDIVNFVNNLHKSGMYAELDLHWSAPGTTTSAGQQVMADYDHSIPLWQSVAAAFKNDPAVTFNLYNEPHDVTWPCWQQGGASCVFGFRIAGMEEMMQAIRSVEGSGWHHPVIVAGIGWSNDLSGWLSNRPEDSANQEIAGIHSYDDDAGGANGCPGTWGGPFNENNCATNMFGGIKAAGYPIMFTEMGDLASGGAPIRPS